MFTNLRLMLIATLVISLVPMANAQGLLGSPSSQTQGAESTDAPKPPANQDVTRVAKRNINDPTQVQFEEISSPAGSAKNASPTGKPTVPQNLRLVPNFPGTTATQEPATQEPPAPTPGNARTNFSPGPAVKLPSATGQIPLITTGWSQQPAAARRSGVSSPITVTSMLPQITSRVIAPRFVNLKQIAPVRIQLRNTTTHNAKSVKLVATLPTHAQFRAAQPRPSNVEGNRYEFIIPTIDANGTQEIQIDVVPTEKKPLNIGTEIWISNDQNVEVGVREPILQIKTEGPTQTHTGKPMVHTVMVENIGDGIAENIKLDCILPEAVELVQGQKEYYLPQLEPGKSTKLQFRTAAYRPGESKLNFQVASRGTQPKRASSAVRVYQPQLIVAATGPKMNFVNRDGIYSIQVENSGQVDVTKVEVAVQIPSGMKVTTVSREARIDKESGIMIWSFDRLSAGAQETVRMKAISGLAGQQVCRIAASSKETRAEKFDLITDVQTRADVKISVNSESGPVEVGNETVFTIQIENRGSSKAEGVEVQVELPPALMPLAAKQYSIGELNNSIQFPTVDLKPTESKVLQFKASGVTKGEHVVRAILTVGQSKRRLIAEDSVYIFETDHSKVTESLKAEVRR